MQIWNTSLEESQWSERHKAERPLQAVVHPSWSKYQGGQKTCLFWRYYSKLQELHISSNILLDIYYSDPHRQISFLNIVVRLHTLLKGKYVLSV